MLNVPEQAKGTPFRVARQKAGFLLSGADADTMRAALVELIMNRPNDVLDALTKAIENSEGW